eukprot:CAMPEP_0178463436 /NCGR_PEP_ID=MMETSP0689_2-20121128/50332_1 /TAXON_ID=160604 /ORGANISM="Amphidinium massartii, Strain CS-259" /LENGTH=129 /DNA_ID=CAMNT_0020090319 /DNA_START=358 /DNA_END=746 /DNA_ORIENTATION=+
MADSSRHEMISFKLTACTNDKLDVVAKDLMKTDPDTKQSMKSLPKVSPPSSSIGLEDGVEPQDDGFQRVQAAYANLSNLNGKAHFANISPSLVREDEEEDKAGAEGQINLAGGDDRCQHFQLRLVLLIF